jgi:anti-sigma regulatory factor (Ser/Thr protein kinase)
MAPDVRSFCVAELLQHLAAEFQVLAAERGLALECVPSQAWVRSDPQLLRRVLQNFLSNAVRYTERGRILLGCRRRGGELALEVWDTGPGIAARDQAVIFEEFRRLDRGGQGLGLGLAIAERIARLLGHRLTLDSRLGRGTAFGIRVPRVAPEAVQTASARPSQPRAPRSRVLLVDNDLAVLKAMTALLDGWHCDVQAARTVAEAERSRVRAAARPDAARLSPRRQRDRASRCASACARASARCRAW